MCCHAMQVHTTGLQWKEQKTRWAAKPSTSAASFLLDLAAVAVAVEVEAKAEEETAFEKGRQGMVPACSLDQHDKIAAG